MMTEVLRIEYALSIASEELKKGRTVTIKPLEDGSYRIQWN